MKKLLLLCLATGFTLLTSAQKVFFLYLQSDDQAPFYIRMGDKIHSSASTGYLILPNLTDSIYNFGLGYAKSTELETKFSVTVKQDDKGYIIKKFDDGLALYDFRDLSIVKSNTIPKDNTVYETKTDAFSSVLSKAANDPSLLKVPVAKKEESVVEKTAETGMVTVKSEEKKQNEQSVETVVSITQASTLEVKPESIKQHSSSDTLLTTRLEKEVKSVSILPQENIEPVSEEKTKFKEDAFKPSVITRYSESSTTEGFGVVYFDKTASRTDTIRIVIPPSKVRLDDNAQAANLSEIEKNKEGALLQIEPVNSGVKLEDKVTGEVSKTENGKSSVAAKFLSSCKEVASDKDFMKLRKKMASEDTDEAMIDEAKKVFRDKCFSVEQLRYLSTLFLTSAAKYQFFDASYFHASDRQNYSALQSEIKDEYYINRFKALIGE